MFLSNFYSFILIRHFLPFPLIKRVSKIIKTFQLRVSPTFASQFHFYLIADLRLFREQNCRRTSVVLRQYFTEALVEFPILITQSKLRAARLVRTLPRHDCTISCLATSKEDCGLSLFSIPARLNDQ